MELVQDEPEFCATAPNVAGEATSTEEAGLVKCDEVMTRTSELRTLMTVISKSHNSQFTRYSQK